jgi:hypothetical protein
MRSIPEDDSGLLSETTVLAVRQRAQDCIKHTVKILRKILSKESQDADSKDEIGPRRI